MRDRRAVRVLNDALIEEVGIEPLELEAATARERAEVVRRVRRYRGERSSISLDGRVVILVDDGLATGYTARAAIEADLLRAQRCVILCRSRGAGGWRRGDAPGGLMAVVVNSARSFVVTGDFYEDFAQTSDEEVVSLLERAAASRARADVARQRIPQDRGLK